MSMSSLSDYVDYVAFRGVTIAGTGALASSFIKGPGSLALVEQVFLVVYLQFSPKEENKAFVDTCQASKKTQKHWLGAPALGGG